MANDFNMEIETLRLDQLNNWPLAKKNYNGLKQVKMRKMDIEGCQVQVQFNPERVRSTTAKVDTKSIKERACFLCTGNRPMAQKGVQISGSYEALINPFPIFEKHLTIPHVTHKKQQLSEALPDLLTISHQLTDYILFYNGPHCGASAPDHLHFQAISRESIPIFNWGEEFGIPIFQNEKLKISTIKHVALHGLQFESDRKQTLLKVLKESIALLPNKAEHYEPMFNLLCKFKHGKWNVILIPRSKHRPEMYFADGEEHFAISPASVDLGGVLVLPFQKDFERVTAQIVKNAIQEVSFSAKMLDVLSERLTQKLHTNFL